jgi:tetratricopeptide (TPR) repeat protein
MSEESDELVKKNVSHSVEFLVTLMEKKLKSMEEASTTDFHPDEAKKMLLRKAHDGLMQWMSNTEERHLIEDGLDLVFKEANRIPNGKHILEEFRATSIHIQADIDNEKALTYDSFQNWMGITEDSMQGMYTIGISLYETRRLDDAQAIFSLLTYLNYHFFEPWLMLGLCALQKDQPMQSIHAFSMATLINLRHPAPHLYSAEVYWKEGRSDLANKILDWALPIIDKDALSGYQDLMADLNKKLVRG